jgi:serine/threonine protein kinase
MAEGSLDRFLANKRAEITVFDMLIMAQQAVSGMIYLEENSIIHRDFALRNLLVNKVDGKYVVKVSDFGMSRLTEHGYYTSHDKTIPIKWSAPEVIAYGRSTSKSDVWSFGICLWEMFSYGMLPYPGMSNSEAAQKVLKGYRMDSPEDCPAEVYNIMKCCWEKEADRRPTFKELMTMINQLLQKYPHQQSTVLHNETHKNNIQGSHTPYNLMPPYDLKSYALLPYGLGKQLE